MASKKAIAKSIIERWAKDYAWANHINSITINANSATERVTYSFSLTFTNQSEISEEELEDRQDIMQYVFEEIQERADREFLYYKRGIDSCTIKGDDVVDQLKVFIHKNMWC